MSDSTLATLTAAAAGTVNGPDMTCSGSALSVGVNITALTGTSPTLQVTISGKDAASGQYYTVLQSAVLAATGFTLLQIGAGLVAAANSVANAVMPSTFRISYTVGGTTPAVTATIGACSRSI